MAMRIHFIALELIFEATLPPMPLVDASLSYGPESTWGERLRTQKALTLVCRSWRVVAVQLLYQDIVLRRVSQIPVLVRSLRANEDLQHLIKRITFACYVPEAWDDVTSQSIAHLMNLCPNLRSISFFTPFSEWLSTVRKDGAMVFDPYPTFMNRASSITHLAFYDHPLYANLANIVPYELLSLFPNLTKLELITYPSRDHFVDRRLYDLHFEYLKELNVRPRQGPIQRDYYEMLKTWHMPRLEYLSADFCMQPPRCRQYDHHVAFFDKFGPQLKRLNIGAAFSPMANRTHQADDPSVITPQSVFFRNCTNLQHAIIALCDVESVERHPKRQFLLTDEFTAWLDIWVPSHYFVREAVPGSRDNGDDPEVTCRYTHTLGERYSRPNVRLIDQALANFPEIPVQYSPDSIEEGDKSTYIHHVYGISFAQSRHFIVREEEEWYDGMSSYRSRYGQVAESELSDQSESSVSDTSEEVEILQREIASTSLTEKEKERAFFETPQPDPDPEEGNVLISEPSDSDSDSDDGYSPRHADYDYDSDCDSDLDSDFTWCSGDWQIHQQVIDSGRDSDDAMELTGLSHGWVCRRGDVKQVTEGEALEIHSRVIEQSS
ncbi:hypothetical protein QCA50_005657 [Cerrena zonata]|uniref:F-box domain-containing protein n=1 Tax=Cerrena zonata TaxID=2478898 RepID=A0AAW0GH38_9APHY